MSNSLISADHVTGEDAIPEDTGSRQPIAETAQPRDGDDMSKPMSRKAMKKAVKAERIAATKLERRAREKEARKEKKRILVEKRAAGELNEEEEEETRKRAKRPKIDF